MILALAIWAGKWIAVLIVVLAILTVVGAFFLGGFDEHKLTKPNASETKPPNPTHHKPKPR